MIIKLSSVLLLLCFLLISCEITPRNFNAEEVSFYECYRENIGDTLFFESNNNELDTIVIVAMDSSLNKGSVKRLANNSVSILIKYLPESIKKENIRNNNNNITKPLLVLSHEGETYLDIDVHYRGYWGVLDDITNLHKDSLLSEFKVNEYWIILPSKYDITNLNEANPKSVAKIMWTKEYGMTSYYLKNGDYYKLKLSR